MKYLETSLTREDIKNARAEAGIPSQTMQVYDCMLCGWFDQYVQSLKNRDCESINQSKQTIEEIFELMRTELSKKTVMVYKTVYEMIKDCEKRDYELPDKIPMLERY